MGRDNVTAKFRKFAGFLKTFPFGNWKCLYGIGGLFRWVLKAEWIKSGGYVGQRCKLRDWDPMAASEAGIWWGRSSGVVD